MAYSNFTIAEVELQFDLQLQAISFLPETTPIAPSDLLNRYIERGLTLAKRNVSEKARSEFSITPILLELETLLTDSISLFSGEDFTVDRSLGLNGICDFLIARSPAQLIIRAPVIAMYCRTCCRSKIQSAKKPGDSLHLWNCHQRTAVAVYPPVWIDSLDRTC